MTYVSNICGEQDIVLQRNRKQFYGETRIQYYKRARKLYYGETRIQYYKEPGNSITEKPGNSITEKQETVSWGCTIEPEKHEKTRKKTLNKPNLGKY